MLKNEDLASEPVIWPAAWLVMWSLGPARPELALALSSEQMVFIEKHAIAA